MNLFWNLVKKILLLLRFTFVENDRHKIVSNALIYIKSVMGSLCFCWKVEFWGILIKSVSCREISYWISVGMNYIIKLKRSHVIIIITNETRPVSWWVPFNIGYLPGDQCHYLCGLVLPNELSKIRTVKRYIEVFTCVIWHQCN